jgi:hypothetical protein
LAAAHCEAGEVAKLDEPYELGIDGRQTRERLVERRQLDVSRSAELGRVDEAGTRRRRQVLVEGHALGRPAALDGPARTGALHEDLPHRQRGNGHEVGAVLEVSRALRGRADERLVDERRGLQRLPGTFASDVSGGNPPQLVVHERHQRADVAGVLCHGL